jgi:hypothetical protein
MDRTARKCPVVFVSEGDEVVTKSASYLRSRARRSESSTANGRLLGLLGLLLTSFGSALFWTGVLALAGEVFGFAVSATMLTWTLLVIAGFLALVCGPLFLKDRAFTAGTTSISPLRARATRITRSSNPLKKSRASAKTP